MKKHFILLLSLSLFLLSCTKEVINGRLKGYAIDKYGSTLSGAKISMAPYGVQYTVNGSGLFEFNDIEPGNYVVVGIYENQVKEKEVTIKSDFTTWIELEFEKKKDPKPSYSDLTGNWHISVENLENDDWEAEMAFNLQCTQSYEAPNPAYPNVVKLNGTFYDLDFLIREKNNSESPFYLVQDLSGIISEGRINGTEGCHTFTFWAGNMIYILGSSCIFDEITGRIQFTINMKSIFDVDDVRTIQLNGHIKGNRIN